MLRIAAGRPDDVKRGSRQAASTSEDKAAKSNVAPIWFNER